MLLRGCLAAAATVVWIAGMNFLGLMGGFIGIVGMFLMVATIALFILTLRSRRRVLLDEAGFHLKVGKKETFIPWNALARDEKTLKIEDVMGWQRINIKAEVEGRNVRKSLDQIFGVGLPVPEIAAVMKAMIRKVKATTG